jgi:hypothetical protein
MQRAQSSTTPEIQALQLKLVKRAVALELFKQEQEAKALNFEFDDE